tara:strand:- start:4351 stop:4668 length:318 start_codon:yes stop_codon:yes gene_type:complete
MQRTLNLHVPSMFAGATVVAGLTLLLSWTSAPAVSPAMDTDLIRVRNNPKVGGSANVTWYIEDGTTNYAEIVDGEELYLVPRNLTAIMPTKAVLMERVDGVAIHR